MVDPRLASIPEAVIELVPESVARELCVLAFRTDGTCVWALTEALRSFVNGESRWFAATRRISI